MSTENNHIAPSLFLIRHGNTFSPGETCLQVGAKTDIPLVAKGKEQAEKVGLWFNEKQIVPAAIFSGPLKRQKETSEIAAAKLSFPLESIKEESSLTEIDFGAWEGLTPEEINSGWPEENELWQKKAIFPENVFEDSFQVRQEAIVKFLEDLRKEFKAGENLLAFSSGGIIRTFYSLLAAEWRKLQRSGQMAELKVGTGNISEIKILESGFKVISWNVKP